MNFVGAAQRVIHAKRDRRADRDEAEDRQTEDFLTALGVIRTKGSDNVDQSPDEPQPPGSTRRFSL